RDEIGRLAKDFSTMSDSLEKTEEKRQEFVSSVSHEIQSPLTSIQGFSRTLREEKLTAEITGEPRLLQQVWMNLVTNAIRYTDAGGTVAIHAENDKSGVHVTIKDTGIGIVAEAIPQLFDRFYKVDKARTRTENSTGLGLAIV